MTLESLSLSAFSFFNRFIISFESFSSWSKTIFVSLSNWKYNSHQVKIQINITTMLLEDSTHGLRGVAKTTAWMIENWNFPLFGIKMILIDFKSDLTFILLPQNLDNSKEDSTRTTNTRTMILVLTEDSKRHYRQEQQQKLLPVPSSLPSPSGCAPSEVQPLSCDRRCPRQVSRQTSSCRPAFCL